MMPSAPQPGTTLATTAARNPVPTHPPSSMLNQEPPPSHTRAGWRSPGRLRRLMKTQRPPSPSAPGHPIARSRDAAGGPAWSVVGGVTGIARGAARTETTAPCAPATPAACTGSGAGARSHKHRKQSRTSRQAARLFGHSHSPGARCRSLVQTGVRILYSFPALITS